MNKKRLESILSYIESIYRENGYQDKELKKNIDYLNDLLENNQGLVYEEVAIVPINLYKELFDRLKLTNGFDSYDDEDVSKDYEYLESKSEENCYISSKETVEIYHKIKELESE